jgi:hypothetical protein
MSAGLTYPTANARRFRQGFGMHVTRPRLPNPPSDCNPLDIAYASHRLRALTRPGAAHRIRDASAAAAVAAG